MQDTQQTDDLIRRLCEHGVDFVIVGGVASALHGASQVTLDLYIAARFDTDNMRKLLASIRDLGPRHALTPGKRTISENPDDVATWSNLYIWTDAGRLDVLGETPPIADYETLRDDSISLEYDGVCCRIASLAHLIAMKSALGRPKDIQTVEELRAVRDKGKPTS